MNETESSSFPTVFEGLLRYSAVASGESADYVTEALNRDLALVRGFGGPNRTEIYAWNYLLCKVADLHPDDFGGELVDFESTSYFYLRVEREIFPDVEVEDRDSLDLMELCEASAITMLPPEFADLVSSDFPFTEQEVSMLLHTLQVPRGTIRGLNLPTLETAHLIRRASLLPPGQLTVSWRGTRENSQIRSAVVTITPHP